MLPKRCPAKQPRLTLEGKVFDCQRPEQPPVQHLSYLCCHAPPALDLGHTSAYKPSSSCLMQHHQGERVRDAAQSCCLKLVEAW